jgi:hypothetical protein
VVLFFPLLETKSKTKKYLFSWMKEFTDVLCDGNTRDGQSFSRFFNHVHYFLYQIAVYKSFTLLPELKFCLCNNLCHFKTSIGVSSISAFRPEKLQ